MIGSDSIRISGRHFSHAISSQKRVAVSSIGQDSPNECQPDTKDRDVLDRWKARRTRRRPPQMPPQRGYGTRFGLIDADHAAQKRPPKPSAAYYSEVIKRNALP